MQFDLIISTPSGNTTPTLLNSKYNLSNNFDLIYQSADTLQAKVREGSSQVYLRFNFPNLCECVSLWFDLSEAGQEIMISLRQGGNIISSANATLYQDSKPTELDLEKTEPAAIARCMLYTSPTLRVVSIDDHYSVGEMLAIAVSQSKPKPQLFTATCYCVKDPSENVEPLKRTSTGLQARLNILLNTVSGLGFNGALLDGWARKDSSTSMTENAVNLSSQTAGINRRLFSIHQPLHTTGLPGETSYSPGNRAYGLVYTDALLKLLTLTADPKHSGRSRLEGWVLTQIEAMDTYYASPQNYGLNRIAIADEPSLPIFDTLNQFDYTPQTTFNDDFGDWLTYVGDLQLSNTSLRAEYIGYLQTVAASASYFGYSSWDALHSPISAPDFSQQNQPATLESRRLYYWSMRFLHTQLAKGHTRLATLFNSMLPSTNPVKVFQNFNNQYHSTVWFRADKNYLSATPDWFEFGREQAKSRQAGRPFIAIQSEDWMYTGNCLYRLSACLDLLKSCSMVETDTPEFGMYYQAIQDDLNVDSQLYRLFSAVVRGMKNYDIFNFGPYPWGGVDSFSFNLAAYPGIAESNQLLAKTEHVLFTAKPSPAKIAILVSQASNYLNTATEYALFQQERFNLQCALSHAGHAVDYIDEVGLCTGLLSKYSVLYITDPAIAEYPIHGQPSNSAYAVIDRWVQAGGVLALVAGAATRDGLGHHLQSGNMFEILTGLDNRKDYAVEVNNELKRPPKIETFSTGPASNPEGQPVMLRQENTINKDILKTDDQQPFYLTSNLILSTDLTLGYATDLNTNTAATEVLYSFVYENSPDATPAKHAIVKHQYGKGSVISYAFFPGLQYLSSVKHPGDALYKIENTKEVENMAGPINTIIMPGDWQASVRELALLPLRECQLAPLATVVANSPNKTIEAQTMEGPSGAAIVLFNWSGVVLSGNDIRVDPVDVTVKCVLSRNLCEKFVIKAHRHDAELPFIERRIATDGGLSALYELEISLEGFTTVDVITVEKTSWLAKLRPNKQTQGPWRLIGGVAGDGGGIAIGPNGKVVKIPPRSP